MKADLLADWDPEALDRQVRASQRQQRYIKERFGTGLAGYSYGDSCAIVLTVS